MLEKCIFKIRGSEPGGFYVVPVPAPAPGKMGQLRLRLREDVWNGSGSVSGQNVPAPDGSGSEHWGWEIILFILACINRLGHVAISGHPKCNGFQPIPTI